MRKWDRIWAAFIAAVLTGFGILEWLGIRDRDAGKPSGTLTNAVRRWMGIDPPHWRRWPLGAAFVAGLGALGLHFLTTWI